MGSSFVPTISLKYNKRQLKNSVFILRNRSSMLRYGQTTWSNRKRNHEQTGSENIKKYLISDSVDAILKTLRTSKAPTFSCLRWQGKEEKKKGNERTKGNRSFSQRTCASGDTEQQDRPVDALMLFWLFSKLSSVRLDYGGIVHGTIFLVFSLLQFAQLKPLSSSLLTSDVHTSVSIKTSTRHNLWSSLKLETCALQYFL